MSESENRGPVRPGNQKPFDLPAGLVAAVGVHALLFVGLFTVFQWRTEPESFYAELWAPEDASGESVAGKAPETPDKPLPKDTEAAPQPDPQEEEAKRLEEERLAQEKLEQEKLEQQRLEQERLEQERLAEQKRLEEERLEQQRLEQERLEQERIAEQKRQKQLNKKT
jgi:colicin import membrane protein